LELCSGRQARSRDQHRHAIEKRSFRRKSLPRLTLRSATAYNSHHLEMGSAVKSRHCPATV